MKTETPGPKKEFGIWKSERSYRYKEEALYSHAPKAPGIYYLATFDAQQNGVYVHMGLTLDKTVFDVLYEHWRGDREPKVHDLLNKYSNLYFGFVVDANCESADDWKDLFWAMVTDEKPMAPTQVNHSGRFSEITYREKSIL